MEEKREITKPRTLSGFMELLPQEQILFNQMVDTIRSTYEKFGFLPLDTPVIELSDVLLAKAGGETEKQIYRFTKGDTDLSLRFDLTVPLAKYVSLYQNELSFPFRRYQIGKVYRGERAQAGRFREFYQCDIDIIGEGELSLFYDAEMPSVIYTIFKELGLGDFTICLNNRKLLNGLFAELNLEILSADIMRIIDKIEKIGEQAVKEELQELDIDTDKVEKILQFINITGSTDEILTTLEELKFQNEIFLQGCKEIQQVVQGMRVFGIPDTNFKVDLTIARGLDYYTGTVYETFLNEYKQLGSICSGGRYENLAEFYTKQKLPGVGISIGLTRLFYQLRELGVLQQQETSVSKVMVVPAEKEQTLKAIEIASKMRQNKITAEVYLNDKKLKAKFKYADRLKIPYLVIIGEEEINNNSISLKNMQTGEQEQMSIEQAIEKLK